MYKNIYYDSKRSKMYIWDENGMRSEDWCPFLYQKSDAPTGIKSIYGDDVERVIFGSHREYLSYQKNYSDIFENSVPPQIQFLTELYHDSDPELQKLHIGYIDIETPHNKGFPNVVDVPAPIVLIAVVDELENRTVFGIGSYNGKNKGKVKYINCDSEMRLLNVFFAWMHRESFDVITGWNILSDSKMNKYGGFDIPYIIRRSIKIFGEQGSNHRKLSPINKVKIWERSGVKTGIYNVDIAGVSVIDYLGLYKWFTFNNLESFRLDYVAEVELDKHKLDYSEYDTMYDFYQQDWDKFVDYCIQDSDIVLELEQKCGYLALAQMLTCYCSCPMKNFNSSVPLIEGLMLKYFRKNNLCAPKLKDGHQVWFPAAYVKEPHIGLHKDVVDLDIASSYPTHIIILNMSLETYFGRIVGFDNGDEEYLKRMGIKSNSKESNHIKQYKNNTGIHEPLHEGRPIYDIVVSHMRNGKFPEFIMLDKEGDFVEYDSDKLDLFNRILKRGLISIAPNGAIFKTNTKGVIAKVEQDTYNKRVKQKGLKCKYKDKAKQDPDNSDHWNEMSQNRHVLQWAIKILINSVFGVMGVPYSRYNNVHMAEAITSCGRHTIKQCEVFVDELLNDPTDGIMDILGEIEGILSEKS